MKKTRKLLIISLAILILPIIAVAGTLTPILPDLTLKNNYCALNNGKYLFTATQSVSNDDDSGIAGYWAKEFYSRTFYVYYMGGDDYCAAISYQGQFKTIVGRASPQNTGTITKVADGFIKGGRIRTFTAHINPDIFSVMTSKNKVFLGVANYDCDGNGNCPGFYDWRTNLFKDITNDLDQSWGWQYTIYGGTWRCTSINWFNTDNGNAGDIVC